MAGIFSFIPSLFKKKSDSFIGVDVGSASIKVVQLKNENGVAVLETYGELALGPYAGADVGQATNLPHEKISENLKDLIKEANVTSSVGGISIPFSKSLLMVIELPNRPQEELENIIPLEARKYIPVSIDEVQLDWFIIPSSDKEKESEAKKIKVLLVAVHNDALKKLEAIVSESNMAASFYEIEIFSTVRSVVNEPIKPVMVIDIGASATKTYIVERGVVAYSHRIARGGQDATKALSSNMNIPFAQAEKLKKENGFIAPENVSNYSTKSLELVYSNIFAEANKALTSFESANNKAVSHIVLSGGGSVIKGLFEFTDKIFPQEVVLADPFANVRAPSFMKEVLKDIGPEFAVSLGLALRNLENS